MTSAKRSWNEMNDSDEDEPSMGKQILPVANLPENFDGVPKDGLQYLFLVRRDARKLPNITRVENPHVLPSPKVKSEATEASIHVKLPSEEWRSTFLTRFKNFRKNLAQATIGAGLPLSSLAQGSKLMPEKKERDKWWAFINGRPECEWNPPKKPKQKNPKSKRGKGLRSWSESIDELNQYEVHYETGAMSPQEAIVVDEHGEVKVETPADYMTSLPTPSSTPQPGATADESGSSILQQRVQPSLSMHRPRQPTPSLLKQMDNRFCTHLLMYFSYWIEQHLKQLESTQPLPYPLSSFSALPLSRLTKTHARWMFSLLSRVDEHITSDEMSNLRSLARACLSVIKDLNKNQSADGMTGEMSTDSIDLSNWVGDPADSPIDERACWIIFAAVTDFWGQKDLWTDAESMFGGNSV